MNRSAYSIGLKALALIIMFSSVTAAQSQQKTTMNKKMDKHATVQKVEMASKMSRAYLNNQNVPSSGIALDGYCPVAYVAANKAIKGKPEYLSTHNGIDYLFINADAKAMFDKEPTKFLPAYGGWCALGMALGDKFPVDPTNFKVIDGKAYLFLKNKNVDALRLWNNGPEKKQVAKAAAHWAKVNK